MTSFRLELDRAGVREAALTSPEIRAELRRIAEGVADRARSIGAGEGVTSHPSEIEVGEGGTTRGRAYVRAVGDAAAAREAKYRILGRALGGD